MLKPIFFEFLQTLEQNNNKEWFDQNRSLYESEIKKPFEIFTNELGNELSRFDAEIQGDFKKSIFRINKDIRFSKEKTPYKTNRSAAYSLNGKKDHEDRGYYIELGAHKSYIAGGAWRPSAEKLQKIRSEIYYNLEEFNEILNDKSFKSIYHDIKGERMKRVPKELTEWVADSDYILNKQFYFMHEFDNKEALKPDFIQSVSTKFQAGYKMNQFLRQAMRD